jgi:hypothetical protein
MKRLSAQAIYNELVAVLRPGETPPERARHTIKDRKIIVTIAWIPLGFPLIVALPKGHIFNSEYYRDNICNIDQRTTGENSLLMLIMQGLTLLKMSNCCEENELGLAPHPPYSPDLALSDFLLFGYVKESLKGIVFLSYDELLDAIGEVVDCRVYARDRETGIGV